jgi:ADP-heptose:LPS heptosyltransferase
MPPKKILALKLRSLGDTVLMTAPLLELRRAFPQAEIHAAVLSTWAPLLAGHSSINRVWTMDPRKDKLARAKAAARLALHLRKENFDTVVAFHASPTSAMIAFSTGARTRAIHFHGHRDKNRYSTVEIAGKGQVKPIIERDMDTLRALGLEIPEGRLPRLEPRTGEMNAAFHEFQKRGLQRPILGIALGASRPTKRWGYEKFGAVAQGWIQKTNGSAVLFTGPGEKEEAAKVLSHIAPSFREKLAHFDGPEIRTLAALLSQCAVVVGNDSGPRHVALAVRTPTVTLFGPEHPFEWHPYPHEFHPLFFLENLSCRKDAEPGMPPWCALETCVEQRHRCMAELEATPVLEACLRVMRTS